jgi:hypothetical protein
MLRDVTAVGGLLAVWAGLAPRAGAQTHDSTLQHVECRTVALDQKPAPFGCTILAQRTVTELPKGPLSGISSLFPPGRRQKPQPDPPASSQPQKDGIGSSPLRLMTEVPGEASSWPRSAR